MQKRFIILLDFSEHAQNLLTYAYQWSRTVFAKVVLVHESTMVIPGISDYETRVALAKEANREALVYLKDMAQKTLPADAEVDFEVSERPIRQTLDQLLGEEFEHLIFVGVKGTGLLKKIFIGSMAVQLIDHTNNLVVAIPQEVSRYSHEKIFIAVSMRHRLNVLELNNFLRFIDERDTTLTFFYLAKPGEDTTEEEKKLRDLAKLFGEKFRATYEIYQGKGALSDIKQVINDKIDEILVVQRGSRLLTDHLFRRFLINELVYEGQTPLVVLP